MKSKLEQVFIYDTTLRDGSQRKGLSFTVEDKIKVTQILDKFGVQYIEGGWPGSNPKDSEYFQKVKTLKLNQAKISAFGSTRRVGIAVGEDPNLLALLEAETPVVTLVGKTWTLHVTDVLQTTLEENLKMIDDSVTWMKEKGKEVIYDAEHFFDGFRADPGYALETLRTALIAGAECLVLCDTNGGSLPSWISEVVGVVGKELNCKLGIHTHNDCELAVANSLAAIEAGCRQVQGTINGYGERCGNANLVAIIPNLQLKLGFQCIPEKNLQQLTVVANSISEIANLNPDPYAAYVGPCAFTHKGGIHVAAVEKNAASYEHINPELVGNRRDITISELSGRGNIRFRLAEMNLGYTVNEGKILEQVKLLEQQGYQFDNAEGTFELIIRRSSDQYSQPFVLVDAMIVSERRKEAGMMVEAMVKIKVGDELLHTAAEGDGPVHALDRAMRKALLPAYPMLDNIKLVDYKVRILNPDQATAAVTRVLIEATDGKNNWATVGCSQNIIEASLYALSDSYELFVLRN